MVNSRANEYLNGRLFSEPRPRPSLLSNTFGHDYVQITDEVSDGYCNGVLHSYRFVA